MEHTHERVISVSLNEAEWQAFIQKTPTANRRDWMQSEFDDLARRHPVLAELVGRANRHLWMLAPSQDGVTALLEAFSERTDDGTALRWSIVSPKGKNEVGVPPEPKPTSSRPSASRSSTAASSATRSGFSMGRVIMAVPRRMRSVCAAAWARKTSGDGRPPSCS